MARPWAASGSAARRLYLRVCADTHAHGACTASQSDLARTLGVTRVHVNRRLRFMLRCRLLRRLDTAPGEKGSYVCRHLSATCNPHLRKKLPVLTGELRSASGGPASHREQPGRPAGPAHFPRHRLTAWVRTVARKLGVDARRVWAWAAGAWRKGASVWLLRACLARLDAAALRVRLRSWWGYLATLLRRLPDPGPPPERWAPMATAVRAAIERLVDESPPKPRPDQGIDKTPPPTDSSRGSGGSTSAQERRPTGMATDAFWSKDDALRYWLKALELAAERHVCAALHESCTLRAGGVCAREVRAVLAAREEVAA